MKQLFQKIFWVMICPLCLMSCEDFLDITPEGQVKQSELLSSAEGIEDALYGAYACMRKEALYGRELTIRTTEVLAQYMSSYGNNQIEPLLAYEYSNTEVKENFETIWTEMYNNISNVNAIINCELVRGATSYPYTIYKGEALGLRAFMHFDLLRLFAEQITQNPEASGIPYATEFSLNTPNFVSAAKAYEYILRDLKEAEQLLANEAAYKDASNFMTERKIHFNLYAVKATLARVYLTMGNKEKALEYALDVIEHSGRKLTEKTEVDGDLAGVLSNNETIFGIYYGNFYSVVYPLLQQTVSFSSLDPRSDLEDFYEAPKVTGSDYRATAYFTSPSSDGGKVRLSKLTNVHELRGLPEGLPKDRVLGINLIRLPEMYYIAAECLLDVDIALATQYFEAVLTNRGLQPLVDWPAPQNVLELDAINDERYRELIGEGQTFFNMKRLNLNILSVDGETEIAASKNIYVVPIPDIELDYRN